MSSESNKIKKSNQSELSNLCNMSNKLNQSIQWSESKESIESNQIKETRKHLIIIINKKNLEHLINWNSLINQKKLKSKVSNESSQSNYSN